MRDDRTNQAADWPLAAVLAGLAMAWALFAWPWLSGAVTIPWDAKAHFAPQVQFLAQSIHRGEWPFWAPLVFAGHPQIADPQSMMFSPPMLLLALLVASPGPWAIDTAVLASVFAGGAGVVLLARQLGWHWAAALIAAIAFMFGGSMAWRLQHFGQVISVCYVPFVLVLLNVALTRGSVWAGLGAGLVAAFIVLGRDQVGLLAVYLMVLYVAWYWLSQPSLAAALKLSLPALVAGGVAGVLVIALPLTLTLLLAGQSNRPVIDYAGAAAGSLHPGLFVTLAIPNLYGSAGAMDSFWGPPSFAWEHTGLFIAQNMGVLYLGAVPALLLAVATVRGWLWAPEVRVVTVMLTLVILYALGGYTPVFRAIYEVVPGIDLFRRPADATFLIGAFAALLAGYSAHRLLSDPFAALGPRDWAAIVTGLALAFGFGLAAAGVLDRVALALAPTMLAAVWFAVGLAALAVALMVKPIRPLAAGALLVVVTASDVAVNNGPNGATALPSNDLAMLDPHAENATVATLRRLLAATASGDRRDRVELAGLGFHWPNAALTHRLETTLGYNPVRLIWYARATGAGDSVGLPDQRTFTPLMPSYASPLADLLGLRFIATGVPIEQIDKTLAPGALAVVARTPDAFIYENPAALPRVLYARTARAVSFANLSEWSARDLEGLDFRTTVLVEAPAGATLGDPRDPGSRLVDRARITRYANTVVEIVAEGSGGFVVLNDVWHPWWRADVDGRPAPVMRANVLFRAVAVPPGRHTVRFTFAPIRSAVGSLGERLLRRDVR